jgi:hypothetical protein
VCSGNQIVTGRSLTQGITQNVVLALDISIPLTKTTEAFCPLRKSEGKDHVYCLLMSKDGSGTGTRAIYALQFTWKYPALSYLPVLRTGPRPTPIIYNVEKVAIDILTRDQQR